MAVEIVTFHMQSDVTTQDFQAAIDETINLLKTRAGFISRTIG